RASSAARRGRTGHVWRQPPSRHWDKRSTGAANALLSPEAETDASGGSRRRGRRRAFRLPRRTPCSRPRRKPTRPAAAAAAAAAARFADRPGWTAAGTATIGVAVVKFRTPADAGKETPFPDAHAADGEVEATPVASSPVVAGRAGRLRYRVF